MGKTRPVYLPEVIEHQGHTYQWSDGMYATFRPGMDQQGVGLDSPAFKPALVVFGTIGVPNEHTFEIAGVTGGESFTVQPADGPAAGVKTTVIQPEAAGRVEVRPTGGTTVKGDILVALYLPID